MDTIKLPKRPLIVHCPTFEEAKELLRLTNHRYSKEEAEGIWEKYREDTCYGIEWQRGYPVAVWGASVRDEYVVGEEVIRFSELLDK